MIQEPDANEINTLQVNQKQKIQPQTEKQKILNIEMKELKIITKMLNKINEYNNKSNSSSTSLTNRGKKRIDGTNALHRNDELYLAKDVFEQTNILDKKKSDKLNQSISLTQQNQTQTQKKKKISIDTSSTSNKRKKSNNDDENGNMSDTDIVIHSPSEMIVRDSMSTNLTSVSTVGSDNKKRSFDQLNSNDNGNIIKKKPINREQLQKNKKFKIPISRQNIIEDDDNDDNEVVDEDDDE